MTLKSIVLGHDFPFSYNDNSNRYQEDVDGHEGTPFWSHVVVDRPWPGFPIPLIKSNFFSYFSNALLDVLSDNSEKINSILRINVNASYPTLNNLPTIPHLDHHFPHKNLLIYLTSAGGATVLADENSRHDPEEDDIILFEGLHYNHPPKKERRVIIVYTFI